MVATLAVMMILSVVGVIVWTFCVTRLQRKPSKDITVMDTEDRAETYLRRIAILTGATRVGRYYILDVSKTRFEVYDSYVCRTPSVTDPTAEPRGTCFYPPNQHMPTAEKIATALLQLKNNPTLFDSWASQSGLFKADGELFRQANTAPRHRLFR